MGLKTIKKIVLILAILLCVFAFFVGILLYKHVGKVLSTLEPDTNCSIAVVRYDTLSVNGQEIYVDNILKREGYTERVRQYLCVANRKAYFVIASRQDELWQWKIGSVALDGQALEFYYSGIFARNYINSAAKKPLNQTCGFFKDGIIVLNDLEKVVEYNVLTGVVVESAYSSYTFPKYSISSEIDNHRTIQFSKETSSAPQHNVLTIDSLADSEGAASKIYDSIDHKIWSGESCLAYFFDAVQMVNDDIYLICQIMNYSGESYAVVLQYDFDTNSCHYIEHVFVSDKVDGNFYIIEMYNA